MSQSCLQTSNGTSSRYAETKGRFGSVAAPPNRQLSADSVENSRFFQTARPLTAENTFFCVPLREICARSLLLKAKISNSSAYFSAVEAMVDFFNRIGQKQAFESP